MTSLPVNGYLREVVDAAIEQLHETGFLATYDPITDRIEIKVRE
jgi:hypothetical protein